MLTMFYVALLLSVLATGIAQVSQESCRDSDQFLEELLGGDVSLTEVGQIHVSHNGAICFNESSQPSCCSAAMEKVFENQAEEFVRQKLTELFNDLEDSIQSHVDEFDHFALYGIYSVHREAVLRLRAASGIFLAGMLDEVNAMYLNMAEYFTGGTITGEEIVDTFFESFYPHLTNTFFGRSTKMNITCVLTVMTEADPNFLIQNRNSLMSAVVRPIIDFRAYSQSLRNMRNVFGRLKQMTITDECKKNIVWSTLCPFCRGLGLKLTACPLLCTRVFEKCTHFSDGVFLNSLITYIDAMNPIAQRVGKLLDVDDMNVAIGETTRAFHFLGEKTRDKVEESCVQSIHSSLGFEVPVIDAVEEDIQPFDDYRTFAETLKRMYVLNNITQKILNQDFFCETSSPVSFPCWTGTHVSTSNADHGFPIFASDTPVEVFQEAKTLKRLAAKLRMISTDGVDPFRPRKGQAGGSLGLSREITLNGVMKNRTVEPGERVVLRCAIAGDPQVEYQWFKDEVLLTEERLGERMAMKTFDWGSKLIISSAEPSDAGYYQCNGSNDYGERSTTGLLVVRIRECPHQWHQFGSSCYSMTSAMTHTSARQECQSTENGDLVSIQSQEENEFITSLVEREKAWIGAWKDGLGVYWLNGDEWAFSAISQIQSYYSECVAINHIGPGIWSSADCGTRQIAVCEVSLS